MNKIIIFISVFISMGLVNSGISIKTRANDLRDEYLHLAENNSDMKQEIKDKGFLIKHEPVFLSAEYGLVMNQVRTLESYSGTSMNIQLDGAQDTDDVSVHYVGTEYKGIKGLKIKIVVDQFSKETDMGTVLDDIHLLEKNTDFMATEMSKDNNNLIVKGEVYGI